MKNKIITTINDNNQIFGLEKEAHIEIFNRGYVYGMNGDSEKAITEYTKAIILKPGYLEALYCRALEYFSKYNYDSGMADLKKHLIIVIIIKSIIKSEYFMEVLCLLMTVMTSL